MRLYINIFILGRRTVFVLEDALVLFGRRTAVRFYANGGKCFAGKISR